MDNILIDYVISQEQAQSGLDIRSDKVAVQRVREAVEKAKISFRL